MAVGQNISILLTRRCNMTCGHCSVESSPHIKTEPTEDELMQRTRDAIKSGVCSILFTGGEPMLREKVLLRLMRECQKSGVKTAITSNGFWGKNPEKAAAKLAELRDAGIGILTISYDRFHADFQGPEPALNIARAGAKDNFPININITRTADDSELTEISRPFEELPNARLRFYDVQPVGRAQLLDITQMRQQIEGFCNACHSPSLTDDGRLIACNGPAYFEKEESPLILGSLPESTFGELIQRHRDDVILDTIRTFGPSKLLDELKQMPGFENFARPVYFGMCDLCKHITSSPQAVDALWERLSDSRHAALRSAKMQLIDHQRGQLYNRNDVNSIGIHKVLFRAMRDGVWIPETPNILGRSDLDWQETATYLAGCGLARPLTAILNEENLTRWAPSFFIRNAHKQAQREALRQAIQRSTLERLNDALRITGTTGVLLKGAAMQALHEEFGIEKPSRAVGDIDLWVAPQHAEELRKYLLDHDFDGKREAQRTGPHHLAPITFSSQMVEIHTGIMPEFWKLPEAAMLREARPLKKYSHLQTLGAEGLLVHGVLHSATHLFANGVKTAWDLADLLQWFPQLDANKVARWIRHSPMQAGFWAVLQSFARELQIEIPKVLLRQAPAHKRQQQLELIARRRLFGAREGVLELNPLTKNALFLMMSGNARQQLQYLGAAFFSPEVRESRRSAFASSPEQSLKNWQNMARESYHQWQSFRCASQKRQPVSEEIIGYDAP